MIQNAYPDDLAARVNAILIQEFPGSQVDVGKFYGAERVSGEIVWDGFEGLDHLDRQKRVHEALRRGLGAEAIGVSTILAYTPHESELMAST